MAHFGAYCGDNPVMTAVMKIGGYLSYTEADRTRYPRERFLSDIKKKRTRRAGARRFRRGYAHRHTAYGGKAERRGDSRKVGVLTVNIVGVCGVAVLCALLCLVLREYDQKTAFLAAICAVLVIGAYCVASMGKANDLFKGAFADSAVSDKLAVMFKALGVGYLSSLAADLCAESGEKALGKQVELAGKCAICLLALPLLTEIFGFIRELCP